MLTKDVTELNRCLLLCQHQQRAPIRRSQKHDYLLCPQSYTFHASIYVTPIILVPPAYQTTVNALHAYISKLSSYSI